MNFRFTVNRIPLSVEFESPTLAEGLDVLMNGKGELARIFDEFSAEETDTAAIAAPGEAVAPTTRKRRSKNTPDASTAAAPPPAPVTAPLAPPAPPAAPPQAGGTDGIGIPAFLDRSKQNAAAAAPPPPPPAAPAPPPVARLADKVIDNLKKRAAGAPDAGKSLADWLAQYGLIVAGASFDEAIAVLQFAKDEALLPVAKALEVA